MEDIRGDQDRTPRPQQNGPWIESVVTIAGSAPGSDDDEIGGSGLPCENVGGSLEGRSPFNALELLPLREKFLPHRVERGGHLLQVTPGRLGVERHAGGSESQPELQAGDSDQGRLNAIRQIEGELDSLLAVALDIEVHHHRSVAHRSFRPETAAIFVELRPFGDDPHQIARSSAVIARIDLPQGGMRRPC
jgi:hypothetical protein